MCRSMVDIQSVAAEIRRGKKEEERKNKPQHENIMVCPIPKGDHKKPQHKVKTSFSLDNRQSKPRTGHQQ